MTDTQENGALDDLVKQDILKSAWTAYGHIDGRNDLDVLCLRISQLDRLSRERLTTSSAWQRRAAFFEAENARLRGELQSLRNPPERYCEKCGAPATRHATATQTVMGNPADILYQPAHQPPQPALRPVRSRSPVSLDIGPPSCSKAPACALRSASVPVQIAGSLG